MWLNRIVLAIGLLISTVAAFYSVTGLTHIFTGATVAVIIMGLVLEAGKVSAAAWLHKYWVESNKLLRGYLIGAVVVLMLITSMGTFGFLSKAHLENAGDTAVVSEQVLQYDDALKRIDTDLARVDTTVDRLDKLVDLSPERATRIRSGQRSERALLATERKDLLAERARLSTERLAGRSKVVSVEAELGPIKYIADMIYGENAGADALDKAVRWMIILLVIVFDPLAISLLIAAQAGFHIEARKPKRGPPVHMNWLDDVPIIAPNTREEDIEEMLETSRALGTELEIPQSIQEVTEPEIEKFDDTASWLENVRSARRGSQIVDPNVMTIDVQG